MPELTPELQDEDRRQAPFLTASLMRTCPRCGQGALFQGYLKLRSHCAACGLDYSKADSGDGPAVFAIFIVGPIAAIVAFWFQWTFQPSIWVFMTVLGALIMALSLAILPVLKAGLVALQYRHRAGEGRLETDEL
jgi:uncharacterized protein (DUF983 family)